MTQQTTTTVPKHLDRPKRRSLPVAVAIVGARGAKMLAAGFCRHVARNAPAYLLAWTLFFPVAWFASYDWHREFPWDDDNIYDLWQKFIKRFAEEVERARGEQ